MLRKQSFHCTVPTQFQKSRLKFTLPVQSPKWRSTFFLLTLLLWEMTQGGIQEGGEHSGGGQMSHFSLFQDSSSHALERGAHNTLYTFTGGHRDWHINAGTKYPVLCPDSSNHPGSILSQLHFPLKLEKGFLQSFLTGRSTARKGVSIPCVLVQLCTVKQPHVVWAAKSFLASAWDLTAPDKTFLAAGPALGSCYGLDQLRSFGGARNCTIKNPGKEQLVNAQTRSWPWHLN